MQTLTTAEELDTMAEGTILMDADGDAWKRHSIGWRVTGDTAPYVSREMVQYGPLTVLHTA